MSAVDCACSRATTLSAAVSILARYGFQHLFNLIGDTSAGVNAGYLVETTGAPMV